MNSEKQKVGIFTSRLFVLSRTLRHVVLSRFRGEEPLILEVETLTALARGAHLPWRAVPGSVAPLRESQLGE